MNRRNLLSVLFIVATLGLMMAFAFGNNELGNAWEALFTLDPVWVLAAFLGIVINVAFDTFGLHYFLRKQKHPVSLGAACYVSLVGFYYSNITPGASGGQPMQVYYLSKKNVPVPIGTSALSIKFFAQQVMIVLMATVLWVSNKGFVDTQLAGVRWMIYIGYALNFASIPLILLVALHRPLVQAVIVFFVRVGAKLKLIKHPEDTVLRISAGLDVYHASILRLAKQPAQIIGLLLLAGISTLGLMSVPLSVYHAFRMSSTPWAQLLTASFLLFISASYTPLPGASGAQEGGFAMFFGGMFKQGIVGVAILVWRFFTFYLFLLIGAAMSIVNTLRENGRRARGEKLAANGQPAAEAQSGDTQPAEASATEPSPPEPAQPSQTAAQG